MCAVAHYEKVAFLLGYLLEIHDDAFGGGVKVLMTAKNALDLSERIS